MSDEFFLTKEHKFRRGSKLTTHYSLLKTQCSSLKGVCKDAKPVRANSRGFSNPWNNDKRKKWRLEDAERQRFLTLSVERICLINPRCRFASSRRHYCIVIKKRGLKSHRLFIFTSFRRIFSHNSLLTAHYSLPITHYSKLITQSYTFSP